MEQHTQESCATNRRAVQDTLEVISGKWKLLILITLENSPYRFKQLAREMDITPRMLSKELQELEVHGLISRTVLDTKPVGVEYKITDYGLTFHEVIEAMRNWGVKHRRKIMSAP